MVQDKTKWIESLEDLFDSVKDKRTWNFELVFPESSEAEEKAKFEERLRALEAYPGDLFDIEWTYVMRDTYKLKVTSKGNSKELAKEAEEMAKTIFHNISKTSGGSLAGDMYKEKLPNVYVKKTRFAFHEDETSNKALYEKFKESVLTEVRSIISATFLKGGDGEDMDSLINVEFTDEYKKYVRAERLGHRDSGEIYVLEVDVRFRYSDFIRETSEKTGSVELLHRSFNAVISQQGSRAGLRNRNFIRQGNISFYLEDAVFSGNLEMKEDERRLASYHEYPFEKALACGFAESFFKHDEESTAINLRYEVRDNQLCVIGIGAERDSELWKYENLFENLLKASKYVVKNVIGVEFKDEYDVLMTQEQDGILKSGIEFSTWVSNHVIEHMLPSLPKEKNFYLQLTKYMKESKDDALGQLMGEAILDTEYTSRFFKNFKPDVFEPLDMFGDTVKLRVFPKGDSIEMDSTDALNLSKRAVESIIGKVKVTKGKKEIVIPTLLLLSNFKEVVDHLKEEQVVYEFTGETPLMNFLLQEEMTQVMNVFAEKIKEN